MTCRCEIVGQSSIGEYAAQGPSQRLIVSFWHD